MFAGTAYDIVILGAGSAGLTAAEAAVGLGLRAAIVERDRIGGDCLWTGCIPSKALIAAARAAHQQRNADRFGLTAHAPDIDLESVWKRIAETQDVIAEHDSVARLEADGVAVVTGPARLTSPHSVVVGERQLTTRFVLVATGSRPDVPSIEGLEDVGYLTTDSMWESPLPDKIAVLGCGPVGMELAQAANRLGISVTLIESGPRVLSADDIDHADRLAGVLAAEGVRILTSCSTRSVHHDGELKVLNLTGPNGDVQVEVKDIVVATGRRPNVEGLELEGVGVELGSGGLVTDDRLRTSVPSIYAAGDVAGRHRFTHSAGYEAGVALRNMFFPLSMRADAPIPWCTFTDPELAGVGLEEAEARARHGSAVRVHRLPVPHHDRALTDREPFEIKVVAVKHKIVGASVVAASAGELINELSLAISRGLRVDQLATAVHTYPSYGTALFAIGGAAALDRARPLSFLARRPPLPWRR